ncbi:MAG: hypothetical protein ACRBDI_00535 [Alphaproteobacteria bacterium]
MNDIIQNTNNTPTDNHGEKQEVIKVTIIGAASSGDDATASATMYKVKGDSSKEWKFLERVLPAPYRNEVAMLTGFVSIIDQVSREAREINPEVKLEVTCVTFLASILTGFNKNRKTWEANGFITSRGNRVKHKDAWKSLFLMADLHSVTFKKPAYESKLMKACTNKARMILREHEEC